MVVERLNRKGVERTLVLHTDGGVTLGKSTGANKVRPGERSITTSVG